MTISLGNCCSAWLSYLRELLPSTKTPRSLYAGLRCSTLFPRLHELTRLHSSRCRVQYLLLLNFTQLVTDNTLFYQDLSARHLYHYRSNSSSLFSIIYRLSLHSMLVSRWLMKTLNRTLTYFLQYKYIFLGCEDISSIPSVQYHLPLNQYFLRLQSWQTPRTECLNSHCTGACRARCLGSLQESNSQQTLRTLSSPFSFREN